MATKRIPSNSKAILAINPELQRISNRMKGPGKGT